MVYNDPQGILNMFGDFFQNTFSDRGNFSNQNVTLNYITEDEEGLLLLVKNTLQQVPMNTQVSYCMIVPQYLPNHCIICSTLYLNMECFHRLGRNVSNTQEKRPHSVQNYRPLSLQCYFVKSLDSINYKHILVMSGLTSQTTTMGFYVRNFMTKASAISNLTIFANLMRPTQEYSVKHYEQLLILAQNPYIAMNSKILPYIPSLRNNPYHLATLVLCKRLMYFDYNVFI